MEKEYIELTDLSALLKEGIEDMFPGLVWVRAEISGLNRKQNGHCYLDLSQSGRGGVIAKVRGTIILFMASRSTSTRSIPSSPWAPPRDRSARQSSG